MPYTISDTLMTEVLPLKHFLSLQTSLVDKISRALYTPMAIFLDCVTEQCWNVKVIAMLSEAFKSRLLQGLSEAFLPSTAGSRRLPEDYNVFPRKGG